MIMVQMAGGLGNQMFMYAFYKTFKEKGVRVCMDDFTHYEEIGRHDNILQEVFPVSYQSGTRRIYNQLTDSSLFPPLRIRRKLFGRRQQVYKEKDALVFEPEALKQTHAYMEGYWQSERYFKEIEGLLRKEFLFSWDAFPEKVQKYRSRIEEELSVSLHVRRGDYLNGSFADKYGGICTESYYEAAKACMKERYAGCHFYLFTNDPKWGREQENAEVSFVDCADAEHDYWDMALMSCCKHHIIANSSFSWWGAWLNASPEKTVIAPAKWLNDSMGQDIYSGLCKVKIDAEGKIV